MPFDSPALEIESSLRREDVGDLLIMDWWFDDEMASLNRDEVQRIVSGQLKSVRDEIVADVVAALKPDSKSPNKSNASKWTHPWIVNIGSAVIGGLVVFGVGDLSSHRSMDVKTEIAGEITTQIGQRRTEDEGNLNNRIATEVGRQLVSVNQQLIGLSQDIGKIKDHLRIAKTEDPRPPMASPLVQFARMDQRDFDQHAAASIPGALSDAQKAGIISDIGTIDAIQRKIALASLPESDALRVAFAVINYASFVRERMGLIHDSAVIRSRQCQQVGGLKGDRIVAHFTGGHLGGCRLRIDGLDLNGTIVENALVTYDGGVFSLRNVKFINCLFELLMPSSPARSPARNFAKELIAKDTGETPSFTLTAD